MILIFHVAAAITSLLVATYTYVSPSQKKLYGAYSLVGMTIASGLYLVWQAPAHMLEVCTMGLVYLAAVSMALMAARLKLVRLSQVKNRN